MNTKKQLEALRNKTRLNDEIIEKLEKQVSDTLHEERGGSVCNLMIQRAKLHNSRIKSSINLISVEGDNLNILIDYVAKEVSRSKK